MNLDLPDELLAPLADLLAEAVASRLSAQFASAPAAVSPWLTVDEAAEYLRCKPKRLYDLTSQSRLPVHRDGSRLLFRRDELDAYLSAADTTLTPVTNTALGSRSAGGQRRKNPVVNRAA